MPRILLEYSVLPVLRVLYRCWTGTRDIVRRVLELNDSPERIARGAALGVFVGMTPTIGVQTLLILLLNTLTRTNRLAGFVMIHINFFPITTPAIYLADYWVGAKLLGQDTNAGREAILSLLRFESAGWLARTGEFFDGVSRLGVNVVLPSFLGGAVLGGAFALLSYPLLLSAVRRYRRLRAKAIAKVEKALRLPLTDPAGQDPGALARRGLVLASSSPRRSALLAERGIGFRVEPSSVDEKTIRGESPRALVLGRAEAKAGEVAARFPGELVLGADTEVVSGGRVLGQPRDEAEARSMLESLSGREHRVLTGICLLGPGVRKLESEESTVRFRVIAPPELDAYLASREWEGKAGAYAIQGKAGAFVEELSGSRSNVVGLPMERLEEWLRGLGF